jgi:hypothetical protein
LQEWCAACGESLTECRAEHSGGAGEENPRGRKGCVDGADVAFLLMNTISAQGFDNLAGRKFILIWTII